MTSLETAASFMQSDSAASSDSQSAANDLWRGVIVVFDSERTPKDSVPAFFSQRHSPNLVFESRFESGNLRQARRM
jgi:hypothetical protein